MRISIEDRLRLRDGMGMGYDQFIWEMKRELIKGGLDLTVLGEDERDPDAWEVQRRLYLDGVGANDLQDAYVKVKNSVIGVIWSFRQALEGLELNEMPSQAFPGAVAIGPERTARIINTVLNVSVIMMVSLMDGMTDMLMGMTGAMAGAFGGQGAEEEVHEAIPEAKAKVQEDKYFTEMFGELTKWMGTLPELPKQGPPCDRPQVRSSIQLAPEIGHVRRAAAPLVPGLGALHDQGHLGVALLLGNRSLDRGPLLPQEPVVEHLHRVHLTAPAEVERIGMLVTHDAAADRGHRALPGVPVEVSTALRTSHGRTSGTYCGVMSVGG